MRATLQKTSFLRNPFQTGSSCVLPISVGWDYHENDYIRSTIELVNQHFSFCRVVVCDTLQRHSLKFFPQHIHLNPESILKDSIKRGDDWIKRNSIFLNQLSVPHSIKRWDDYTKERAYTTNHKQVEKLLKSKFEIMDLFNVQAERIYQNLTKKKLIANHLSIKTKFIEESIDYLIEECAVIIGWQAHQESILLYPKSLGHGIEKVLNHFLGEERNFLQPLQLRFK